MRDFRITLHARIVTSTDLNNDSLIDLIQKKLTIAFPHNAIIELDIRAYPHDDDLYQKDVEDIKLVANKCPVSVTKIARTLSDETNF